ncbi:MAG: hypothetical protein EOP45_03120 [Sphingobacteriaceae bacterium]|nr:MAG: hypothetical protein EOP45_03120 [Sphingobacteriaceae bacterium]
MLSFLKAGDYRFTPLHDNEIRQKDNLKIWSASTNFIIDQKGRIVYSDLQRSVEDERTLEISP